jgi:8-oxo-dGTP pyrophosphatase MutT (NUDIX family)
MVSCAVREVLEETRVTLRNVPGACITAVGAGLYCSTHMRICEKTSVLQLACFYDEQKQEVSHGQTQPPRCQHTCSDAVLPLPYVVGNQSSQLQLPGR